MNNQAKSTVLCLMGPTASGKSQLALEFSQKIDCEIICVDSAVVYRGMDIGTAKPSAQERNHVPHHLIDICDPSEAYSAGQFVQDVNQLIADIQNRGRVPLLVGGTMLYFYRLQQGLADLPEANQAIRKSIVDQAEKEGWPQVYAHLQAVDPVAAARIHANDKQRIQRALEIYQLTGKPISQLQDVQQQASDDHFINFFISPVDRSVLHARIADRFKQMIEFGLIEEVEQLYKRQDLHVDLPAIRMVGYRQVWGYLSGHIDHIQMVAQATAATRQLAKRQLTWLNKWSDMIKLDMGDSSNLTKMLEIHYQT